MLKTQEYLTVAGLFLLAGAAILLLSTPEDLFSSVVVIDISKTHKTPYEIMATTLFDFKNTGELINLPTDISGLHSRDVEPTETERRMGALVKRMYSNGTDAVIFMLLSSRNMSAFHNLEICYGGRWNITENTVIPIETKKLGEAGFYNIHVKKFITKRKNLEMIVLHWFMWEGGIVRTEKNFMLIQVAAPVKESREKTLDLTKKFTTEFFLRMYKPVTKSKIIAEQIIDRFGVVGYLLNTLLIALPLLMIFNTKIRRR